MGISVVLVVLLQLLLLFYDTVGQGQPGQLASTTPIWKSEDVTVMEKCDRDLKKMILQSTDVVLSKLVNADGKLWCHVADTLEIYALETIVLDSDIAPGLKDVTMMAKEWIVKGNRTIDLRGTNGTSFESRAPNGNSTFVHGTDGDVGGPGGSGGSFYGHFEKITLLPEDSSLTINVDGGLGGKGQDGGNGENGQHGSDATYANFPSAYSDLSIGEVLSKDSSFNGWYTLYTYSHTKYVLYGTTGQAGGNGGAGGVGGIGGNPGYLRLPSNYNNSTVKMSRKMGDKGLNGKGGRPGEGSRHGSGYQCFWRGLLWGSIRWWDKCSVVEYSQVANDLYAPGGTPGRDGGNVFGLQRPQDLVPDSVSEEVFNQRYLHFRKFVVAKTGMSS